MQLQPTTMHKRNLNKYIKINKPYMTNKRKPMQFHPSTPFPSFLPFPPTIPCTNASTVQSFHHLSMVYGIPPPSRSIPAPPPLHHHQKYSPPSHQPNILHFRRPRRRPTPRRIRQTKRSLQSTSTKRMSTDVERPA
ncbi:hypothetical protein BJ508DRAFT_175937 [Ascobolus immersus RN42]|uniref:Uncharacterized protein n=1 Tax=Ascobolus immersus RN42 TaxID=1160509 RepID=A0A3N4HYU5_ASCIM|nr:hypothetical protein BJ508DRAFT_175937 [Ascobolus immersus RN42]